MTTILVTPRQAASILSTAKVLSTGTSKINGIDALSIRLDHKNIVVVATDRFRVVRLTIPADTSDGYQIAGDPLILRPAVLEQALKMMGKGMDDAPVIKIHQTADTYEPISIELTHTGTKVLADSVVGSYPPVERLLEGDRYDDIYSGVLLDAGRLATLALLRLPGETPAKAKVQAWELTTKNSDNGRKNSPLMFTRSEGENSLEYLLQPNLIR